MASSKWSRFHFHIFPHVSSVSSFYIFYFIVFVFVVDFFFDIHILTAVVVVYFFLFSSPKPLERVVVVELRLQFEDLFLIQQNNIITFFAMTFRLENKTSDTYSLRPYRLHSLCHIIVGKLKPVGGSRIIPSDLIGFRFSFYIK